MINELFKPILEALPENNRAERIWVLAKTDFLKRYYGSFLGVVWALINPIMQLCIYYFVFTVVFQSKQPNFALFLFLGLIMFMFFAEISNKGLSLVQQKRYLLENIPLNWIDIYLAASASTFFAFLFNFLAYLIVSLFYEVEFNAQILLFPILILNLFGFALAVQIMLSVIQIFLKDIAHLWDMARMALLWLSGVFFPIDSQAEGAIKLLAYLSPLSGIISNSRKLLIYGEKVDLAMFGYDLMYTAILLGIALMAFKFHSRKALEKL